MKNSINFFIIIALISLISCNSNPSSTVSSKEEISKQPPIEITKDTTKVLEEKTTPPKDKTEIPIPQLINEKCDCDVYVYTFDPDDFTNVRDKPKGEIIAKLPTIYPEEDNHEVMFSIKAYDHNWLQIKEVSHLEDEKFKEGWVFGKLVGLSTRHDSLTVLYANPSHQAPKTSNVAGFNRRVAVLKCCGKWIYTEGVNEDNSKFAGWLAPEDQCSIPVTTCP